MNNTTAKQSSTRKAAKIFTMQNDDPKENNLTSDSDSDPGVKDWTKELISETLGNEASILNNQQRKPAIDESSATSETQSVDDQQPSTSRETDISSIRCVNNQGLNANRITPGSKRKPITDGEDYQHIKKRRSELHNVRPHVSQSSGGSNLDFGRTSAGENLNPGSRFDRKTTYPAGGLTSFFHGVVYQLKHLGYTLLCAIQEKRKKMEQERQEIRFLLSAERVDVGKFDDLVLEYRDNQGKNVDLFLQLKHSRSTGKQVNAYDLLEKEDGDFFLPKYFRSWREIKKSPLFSDDVSRNVVLGTNIGLNLDELKNARISHEEISKPVECLKMIGTKEETTCFKLTANEESNQKIYAELKKRSDMHMLARELAEHVVRAKQMKLVGMFKQYHTALGKHVIDTKNKKFLQSFVKKPDSPSKTENFRDIFFDEFSKLRNRGSSNDKVAKDVIWKEIEDSSLMLSENFGKPFKLPVDPQLTDVSRFSQEFGKLLTKATTDNVVNIPRKIYRKRARKGSVERVIADNIDKLAGHVLIKKRGKIKFRTQFFDDGIQSPGNIGKFKDSLKSQLGSKYDELYRIEIKINEFKTCEEEELYPNTELPVDDITKVDITEFLNVFIIAVNLPNEVELGQMITDELGDDSKFNLLDADLVGRTFLTEIVDWFKGKDNKVGKGEYLTYKGGEDFFKEMEAQINALISTGIGSVYWEELMEYDVDFECENTKLKAFLSKNEPNPTMHRILMLMAPKEPLLTALRVRQALSQEEKFTRKDSFIFIRLRTLSLRGIKDQVVRVFQSQRSHHLLVIECDSASMRQNLQGLWLSLCEAAENIKDANKTVILIVREDKDLATSLAGQFERVYTTRIEKDDISFEHLTEGSQLKLMEKRLVNFQGYGDRISFGRLLGVEVDNIGINRSIDVAEIIDANTLVSLIRGDGEIQIGNEFEGLGKVKDYYIDRRIVQYVAIKRDIFQDGEMPDLLVISGIIEKSWSTMRRIGKIVLKDKNLDDKQELEKFKTWLDQDPNRNIHWLKEESGKYIWKRSVENITYLLRHRDVIDVNENDGNNDRAGATYLNEDQFAAHDGPVIVSDTAGMGKSTLFTYLARKLKETESDLLVLKIDLNRHTDALAKVQESTSNLGDTTKAVKFLLEELLDLKEGVKYKVFKAIIEKQCRTALIFDAFDEISPHYEGKVINLLDGLSKHTGIRKLFVATRPHTRGDLEKRFNTFSYELKPFSMRDQKSFLINFWRNELGLKESYQTAEGRLKKYADAILAKLANSIDDRMNEFTGIPLRTKLVAEIFKNQISWKLQNFTSCKEFIDSTEDEPNLPNEFNLISLYKNFVEMKYEYFFKKRECNCSNPAVMEDRETCYKEFINTHKNLALDALFDEDTVNALLPVQTKLHSVVERTGIITHMIGRKPHFGHRTYAEYFAANFLSDKLKEGIWNPLVRQIFLADILLKENYKTLRAFLNDLLPDEDNDVRDCESWECDWKDYRSKNNETLLHVASTEGNHRIIQLFLNHISKNSEDRIALINAKDKFSRTAVEIGTAFGYVNVIELLFKHGNIKLNATFDYEGRPLLHVAVEGKQLNVVEYLVEHGADIRSPDKKRRTPLLLAAINDNFEIVRYLVEHGADIQSQDEKGRTPLSSAAKKGNSKLVQYLVEHGADIQSQNKKKRTPLFLAAMHDNSNIVRYLVEHGADIQSEDKKGRTPLSFAAENGNSDLVRYLVEHGADIQSKDKKGRTPRSLAAMNGHSDIERYLVEHEANI